MAAGPTSASAGSPLLERERELSALNGLLGEPSEAAAGLVPKYPPGTFSIYSCLGSTKWKARPAR